MQPPLWKPPQVCGERRFGLGVEPGEDGGDRRGADRETERQNNSSMKQAGRWGDRLKGKSVIFPTAYPQLWSRFGSRRLQILERSKPRLPPISPHDYWHGPDMTTAVFPRSMHTSSICRVWFTSSTPLDPYPVRFFPSQPESHHHVDGMTKP